MDSTLASEGQFQQAYRQKLCEMLRPDTAERRGSDLGLAAFILVCANAYFDAEVLSALEPELHRAFGQLKERYGGLLAAGQLLDEHYAEDLLVFLKIALVGLDQLQVTQHKQLAWWRIQYNHLRSFRPQRAAARPVAGIDLPFNPHGFFYSQALCERESFWSGTLEGKRAYLLYNKYPFARMHALLIPEPHKRQRQFLTREYHHWAWKATAALGQNLPGFGMGFNSLGTFASVNHLHFQTFIEPRGMPVTWPIWKHNGGSEIYPTACRVFEARDEAWQWMEAIHQADDVSYNLLYMPNRLYCFERKRQGTYKHARWTSGFAWYEMSGNLITFNWKDYTTITFEQIQKEFMKVQTPSLRESLV